MNYWAGPSSFKSSEAGPRPLSMLEEVGTKLGVKGIK